MRRLAFVLGASLISLSACGDNGTSNGADTTQPDATATDIANSDVGGSSDSVSGAPTAESLAFAGHYFGDWGRMIVEARADGLVYGVYDYDQGTFVGKVIGTKLYAWWCEVPTRTAESSDAGPVLFQIVTDGGATRIEGRWTRGEFPGSWDTASWYDDWVIDRIDEAIPEELAARLTDASAFCGLDAVTLPEE